MIADGWTSDVPVAMTKYLVGTELVVEEPDEDLSHDVVVR